MTVGDRIKKLREEKQLTQEELAKSINSTKQTIYKYENNIITNIPSDKIEIIAKALNTSPTYLMGWDDIVENLKKIENEIMRTGKKVYFATFLESFGYKVEERFATDENGNTTVLFESVENELEKFEIKESDYEAFEDNVFSFIEYGLNKLISKDNRVKSKFFIKSFPELNNTENKISKITDLPKKEDLPDHLILKAANKIDGASEEDNKQDDDIMNDPNF